MTELTNSASAFFRADYFGEITMFIDMHVHMHLFPCPPIDGYTIIPNPEQVLELYDARGIDCGAIMPIIGPEYYVSQSNEEALEICSRYPGRFIPFFNIDPRGISNSPKTDFTPWLSWYRDHGFRGVGEFMPNLAFDDPFVLNLFSQIQDYGFSLTFDISDRIGERYGLYDDPGLPRLEKCLKLFPNLKIVGHGPAYWNEIGEIEPGEDRQNYIRRPVKKEGTLYRLFREYPNMYADLSAGSGYFAITRDHDNAVKFINEFQDRLFYATDICSVGRMYDMDKFLLGLLAEHSISQETFDKIARNNAKRLLKLD